MDPRRSDAASCLSAGRRYFGASALPMRRYLRTVLRDKLVALTISRTDFLAHPHDFANHGHGDHSYCHRSPVDISGRVS